jgi:hypothetical protein
MPSSSALSVVRGLVICFSSFGYAIVDGLGRSYMSMPFMRSRYCVFLLLKVELILLPSNDYVLLQFIK